MLIYPSREISIWVSRYKNKKTRQQAQTSINSLIEFVNIFYKTDLSHFVSALKNADKETKMKYIEFLIRYWGKINYSSETVRSYLRFIKEYLAYHDVTFSKIKLPRAEKEERYSITQSDIEKIFSHADNTAKAFFHLLMCGLTKHEILELKKQDVTPDKITITWKTSHTQKTKIVPITSEAWSYLKPLYDNAKEGTIEEQVRAFCTPSYRTFHNYIFPYTKDTIQIVMSDLRKKTGLVSKYKTGAYQINLSSFRKFGRNTN